MAARKNYTASRAVTADEPGDEIPQSPRRRIAALVAAGGGWFTTWLCVQAIGLGGWPGVLVSLVIEWILFEFKRDVLSGKDTSSPGGITAIIIDTVLNGGGMWSVVLHLDNTDSYEMFAKSFELDGKMSMLPALAISLALGYILTIAPHQLWHGRPRRRKE
jgi:hypothetical protein